MLFLIPLLNTPQQFQIVLAGITYLMTSKWSDYQGWVIDIADQNDNPIVSNIPLITGADCLQGLSYLGINGELYVYSNAGSPVAVPTLDNLGTDSNLYFYTEVASG